jgi:hypothetical protein
MSIERKRHTEMDGDKFIYVIEMPNRCDQHAHPELDREMFKVKFWNGVGKTTIRSKAIRFDEWYGYKVYIHKDDEPWELAQNRSAVTDFIEDETHIDIDTEELEEDEKPSPKRKK